MCNDFNFNHLKGHVNYVDNVEQLFSVVLSIFGNISDFLIFQNQSAANNVIQWIKRPYTIELLFTVTLLRGHPLFMAKICCHLLAFMFIFTVTLHTQSTAIILSLNLGFLQPFSTFHGEFTSLLKIYNHKLMLIRQVTVKILNTDWLRQM